MRGYGAWRLRMVRLGDVTFAGPRQIVYGRRGSSGWPGCYLVASSVATFSPSVASVIGFERTLLMPAAAIVESGNSSM